ncbi:MAG: FAD-dependent thymidylate synthase [Bacteroidales bacterium]|nr:FAD-dependent thymidylate synthase [Bacteroidales bacterium]
MKDFTVTVRKVTDEELMRSACEMTFLGKSSQSLLSIYKSEHSPVRTQMFWVELKNIPLASSTHILRHHVGSTPYQLSCRDDRNGGYNHFPDRIGNIVEMINAGELENAIDELNWLKDNADRQTPVNLGLFLNAQSLIDMSKLRLCSQAHKETLTIFRALKAKIAEVDPSLAYVMVRKCVYRGGICGEPRCCGFNSTEAFKKELGDYLSNFSDKQRGIHYQKQ